MTSTAAEHAAMRRALALAGHARCAARTQPARRLRAPRPDGAEVAEGFHRGAGTPARRGRRAAPRPGTRPRRHRRRDPRALQPHRPHRPVHRGAARRRRAPGGLRPARPQPGGRAAAPRRCAPPASTSRAGCWRTRPRAINRAWTFAVEHGRPFVTWKFATTLDGRSAAADGTSRWISSRAARLDTHRLRAECDVMLVGTGTVAVDDPAARRCATSTTSRSPRQPLRVVMGQRDLAAEPAGASTTRAETLHAAHPRPARRRSPSSCARGRPARLPRGRPDPGRGVPRRRAGRRGRRVRRADAARRRPRARSATSASPRSPTRSHLHGRPTSHGAAGPRRRASTNVRLTLSRPAKEDADVHRHRRGARRGRALEDQGDAVRLTIARRRGPRGRRPRRLDRGQRLLPHRRAERDRRARSPPT